MSHVRQPDENEPAVVSSRVPGPCRAQAGRRWLPTATR